MMEYLSAVVRPLQRRPPTLCKFLILNCSLALLCVLQTCASVDTISANQTIRDGETIISAGEKFEMGFFSTSNSRYKYFGIWYKKVSVQTVVWVANRETPVTNNSGILRFNRNGVIEILNGTNSIIWSSNSSGSVSNPIAQLLDTGNLVIRDRMDNNPNNFIWQSFDFPVDTLLPGMKFGKNFVTGREWLYRSWNSADDPSPGNFSTFMDTDGYPQNILKKGSEIVFRSGPWNGVRFSGEPNMKSNSIYTFELVFNQKMIYYHDELISDSVIMRVIITPNGEVLRLLWIDSSQQWTVYLTQQTDNCDRYGLCGVNGNCNINHLPACECLQGFQPRSPELWKVADWSHGCRRTTPLDCGPGEGFVRYSNKKLPDTQHSWYNLSMNLEECKQLCKNNCSCTAYANADIRGSGSGCILWFGDLLDIRDFPSIGQDVYIRMAASELVAVYSGGKDSIVVKEVKILIPVISAPVMIIGFFLMHVYKKSKLKREGILKGGVGLDYNSERQNEELELPLFSLSTLLKATNNFSIDNKLGEGAFGPVYKGTLSTGQEIAVKRLSKNSRQGIQEFKNEIFLISKLQHRNLVKISGCCFEGEERMLVYEYMPNKSLDYFIFDMGNRVLLTWQHRVAIAIGIAKGLLYLHHDSRLRIIHRDLKASNILLDSELKPKISDFGTARIFGGEQCEDRTKHVIGTYGYMSPEYTIYGQFSVKSDVFSFGVLLIEIISGKKNTKYQHPDHHHSLLGHAWLLWKEGKALQLVDATLMGSCLESQVLRFIQVGLLCIQKFPKDRPTMASVVFMLSNEGAVLPQPSEPGFYMGINYYYAAEEYTPSCQSECAVPTTTLEGR